MNYLKHKQNMNDHISSSSVSVDRRDVDSVEEFSETINMTRDEVNLYLSRIRDLEENIARERKIKAGLKVMLASLEDENGLFKSRMLKKFKKRVETEQIKKESEVKTSNYVMCNESRISMTQPFESTHPIRESTHPIRESAHPIRESTQPIMGFTHKSTTTQTSPVFEIISKGHTRHSSPEKICKLSSASLLNLSEKCTKDKKMKDISELLDRIEDLTDRLREADNKVKEATERSDMMAIQMETYKVDFMSERSDRENAMGKIMELEKEVNALKRQQSEDRHYQHQHSFPCHVGSSNTRKSPSFLNHDFQIASSDDFKDDVLIARGGYSSPFQESSMIADPEQFQSSGWSHQQGNKSGAPSSGHNSKRHANFDSGSLSSTESLNLLTTEHGGDDYYR